MMRKHFLNLTYTLRKRGYLAVSWFSLLCLLFSGCSGNGGRIVSDPIANVTVEQRPLALESAELRPIIFGREFSGARYALLDGKIIAVAGGFVLDLIFNDSLDPQQIQNVIQIKGPTDAVFFVSQPDTASGNSDHIITIYAPEIEPGDYQLAVPAVLAGRNTLVMEEAVVIDIQLDGQTEGAFFLLDSSGLPRPVSYEECRTGLALSDTAKTFIIQFNQEVNQISVEDSLISGLREQPVITAFSWMTPQQLRVNLTQLQNGMSYHLILDRGVDNKGNGIVGSCYFRTGKASNVGIIQLSTSEMNMLYQFSEERYSGVRSQTINNRVLLQAGDNLTFCFSLGARQLFALPSLRYDLAIPQSYREPVWTDYDHLLGYDNQDNTLSLVSIADGTIAPVYTLPDRPLECRLSPNGRFLAVAFRASADSRKADLMLIDVQKKTLLDHVRTFAQPYITPAGFSAINLTWSGNDSFLYVDGSDILRAYLSADGHVLDRKNTIEKDGRIVDYLLAENLLLYKSVNTGAGSLYLIQENKSRQLKDLFSDERDFYCVIVDGETILFESGDMIYRYSISRQTAEMIGGGLLLGVSAAREKAYYMINAEDYGRSAP